VEVKQRAQQARLLDQTHDPILVRDMNSVITYWNRAAEELYGGRRKVIGRRSYELLKTVFPRPWMNFRSSYADGPLGRQAHAHQGRWRRRDRRLPVGATARRPGSGRLDPGDKQRHFCAKASRGRIELNRGGKTRRRTRNRQQRIGVLRLFGVA
jgi:PAS domain S-box-containing protein